MSETLIFLAGAGSGLVLGAGLCVATARRVRAGIAREITSRVQPVLERRAAALKIEAGAAPALEIGVDGELRVRDPHGLQRVLRLADAIDTHEQSLLGYVDTIRVSKEDVDAQMPPEATGRRARNNV